jgi:hypothetical protein
MDLAESCERRRWERAWDEAHLLGYKLSDLGPAVAGGAAEWWLR